MSSHDSLDAALGGALRALINHPGLDEIEIVVWPRYPKGSARPIVLLDLTTEKIREAGASLPYPKPLQAPAFWAAVSLEGQILAQYPDTEEGKAAAEGWVANTLDAVRVVRVKPIEASVGLGGIFSEIFTQKAGSAAGAGGTA